MSIEHVVVLGAGTMGRGIAQAAAVGGMRTTLRDIDAKVLSEAQASVEASLAKGIEKGKVDADLADAARRRLSFTESLGDVEDAGLVIEAVPEDLDLKKRVIAELNGTVPSACVVATNTSALSVARIAEAFEDPSRVVGMHFFNPAHIQPLVEVVRPPGASEDAVKAAVETAKTMGKTPIVVKDAPGFASSRLGLALGLEAMRMVQEGVASAEDIDTAMRLGYRHPMGPLELTDLVGLDVRLAIARHLAKELGPAFKPPKILEEKVAAGELGRKSGKGFYEYGDSA